MENQELNHLFHSVYRLTAHLVIVTKYRRRVIDAVMLEQIKQIAGDTCQRWGCRLLEFSGEADHVHLLLDLNPKVAPSEFVNTLKTVTSRLIRRDHSEKLKAVYRNPVFWSRSYCMVSVGGAPLAILKKYIESQDAPEL